MLELLDKDTLRFELEKTDDGGCTVYLEHETLPLTNEIRKSVRRIYQLRTIEGDSGRFEPELDEEHDKLISLFKGPTCRDKGKRNYNWTWWDDIVDHQPREFVDELVELLHP